MSELWTGYTGSVMVFHSFHFPFGELPVATFSLRNLQARRQRYDILLVCVDFFCKPVKVPLPNDVVGD